MEASRQVAAAARLMSVLAVVIGVIAMHTLVTGHHGESRLPPSGAPTTHVATASHASADLPDLRAHAPATGDRSTAYISACDGACVQSEPDQGPLPSVHLLDVCMAIVLAAAAGVLRRHLRGRVSGQRMAARVRERLIPAHLPCLTAPNLFQLGILRT